MKTKNRNFLIQVVIMAGGLCNCAPTVAYYINGTEKIFFGQITTNSPEITIFPNWSRFPKDDLKKFKLFRTGDHETKTIVKTLQLSFWPAFFGTGLKLLSKADFQLNEEPQLLFVLRSKEKDTLLVMGKRKPFSDEVGLAVAHLTETDPDHVQYVLDDFYWSSTFRKEFEYFLTRETGGLEEIDGTNIRLLQD